MKKLFLLVSLFLTFHFVDAQIPCSYETTIERMIKDNPNIESELADNENFTKQFIAQLREGDSNETQNRKCYLIKNGYLFLSN